jgi:hypothetical protein
MAIDAAVKKPFLFTTRYLLVLIIALAILLALVRVVGLIVIVLSIVIWGVILIVRGYRFEWSMLLFTIAILLVLGLSAIGPTMPPTPQSEWSYMKLSMVKARLTFQDPSTDAWPQPYSIDAHGQPLHSWRVHLLPELGHQQLYDDLDLTKPWNHPDNLKHAHRIPNEYQMPFGPANTQGTSVETCIVAVIGDRTSWHPEQGLILPAVPNDEILAIVESQAHKVHWMSPHDPRIEDLKPSTGQGDSVLDGGPFEGFIHVITASNRFERVPSETLFEVFMSRYIIDRQDPLLIDQ